MSERERNLQLAWKEAAKRYREALKWRESDSRSEERWITLSIFLAFFLLCALLLAYREHSTRVGVYSTLPDHTPVQFGKSYVRFHGEPYFLRSMRPVTLSVEWQDRDEWTLDDYDRVPRELYCELAGTSEAPSREVYCTFGSWKKRGRIDSMVFQQEY